MRALEEIKAELQRQMMQAEAFEPRATVDVMIMLGEVDELIDDIEGEWDEVSEAQAMIELGRRLMEAARSEYIEILVQSRKAKETNQWN